MPELTGTETLVTVLLSLLGLGVMRTAEKFGRREGEVRNKLAINELGYYVIVTPGRGGVPMKAIPAREAKLRFGRLIDTALAEPVVVEKHGRPVVVVLAVEEFEKLTGESISPSCIDRR